MGVTNGEDGDDVGVHEAVAPPATPGVPGPPPPPPPPPPLLIPLGDGTAGKEEEEGEEAFGSMEKNGVAKKGNGFGGRGGKDEEEEEEEEVPVVVFVLCPLQEKKGLETPIGGGSVEENIA